MREPFITDFLWYRYQLLRAPEGVVTGAGGSNASGGVLISSGSRVGGKQLCYPHSLANGTAMDSRRASSEFDWWLRYGFVSWMFPVLWLVAAVGISVTLLTIRKHPKVVPSTTRVLLVSLFIVDGLVLSIVGLRWWSYTVFGADFRNSYALLSSACNYANYLLVHLSGWLQACIFVERMLVVRDPMLAKTYLRPRRARLCLCVLTSGLAVLNLPVAFLTYNFAESSVAADSTVWLLCSDWAYLGLKVVGLADLLVGSVLPLLIMLTGTVVISAALLSKKELLASRQPPSPQANVANSSCGGVSVSIGGSGGGSSSSDGRVHCSSANKRRKRQQRICVVSLVMNGLYLVTNYPLTVVLLYTTFSRQSGLPPTFSAFTILYLLSLVNNATNWALLTLTGRGYRKKLASVLGCASCCYRPRYPALQARARARISSRGSSASAMVIIPS